MLENLLKLENIQILNKKEQLLQIQGGAYCTDPLDVNHCHTFV